MSLYIFSIRDLFLRMGSTARGLITGFICRLCSKMNRYVILIYGEEGERMGLAEKINSYLPITVRIIFYKFNEFKVLHSKHLIFFLG